MAGPPVRLGLAAHSAGWLVRITRPSVAEDPASLPVLPRAGWPISGRRWGA